MKKILLFIALIPSIAFCQSKLNFNAGAVFAADAHDFGNGGATVAGSYFVTDHIALGIAGDVFAFDNNKAKYGVARGTAAYYLFGSTKSSMFISAEPGWTIYDLNDTKGNFAIDGMIGGKMKFGKAQRTAVYLSMGYGRATFKTGKYSTANEGFKLRLAFGI